MYILQPFLVEQTNYFLFATLTYDFILFNNENNGKKPSEKNRQITMVTFIRILIFIRNRTRRYCMYMNSFCLPVCAFFALSIAHFFYYILVWIKFPLFYIFNVDYNFGFICSHIVNVVFIHSISRCHICAQHIHISIRYKL